MAQLKIGLTTGEIDLINVSVESITSSDGTLTVSAPTGVVDIIINRSHSVNWLVNQQMSLATAWQFRDTNATISSSTSGTIDIKASTIVNVAASSCTTANFGTGATTTNVGQAGDIVVGSSGNKCGFYGNAGSLRQVLATGAGHTVDDVITALQNLNLVSQT